MQGSTDYFEQKLLASTLCFATKQSLSLHPLKNATTVWEGLLVGKSSQKMLFKAIDVHK